MSQKAKITFLGGLDTIGKNMMVIEDQSSAIIIDCGMTFPEDEMYGINIVIPSFDYIKQIKSKLKALILTHGHEDHIGALGYFYRQFNPPLYGTALTLAFADSKFNGEQKKKIKTFKLEEGKVYTFGSIKIEPFAVCHSIPEGVGLIIEAGGRRIVHSGDFKLDPEPIDGRFTDLDRLKKLRNVDLLMCDSTNADQTGNTYSEAVVGRTFSKLFAKTKGRIVIASFSSNILRVQEILNVAKKHNRKVAILGRNMQTNFTIARQAGVIKCANDQIFDIGQINQLKDEQVVIITTGSQGEKMSALTHMAKRSYEKMKLKKEDTVIISATPIPGNEQNINRTVDNLYRLGVNLYYDQIEEIHASGHACAEEIKKITKIVRPKSFIPIHGEYKHLLFGTCLAQECGVHKNNALIVRNGDQIEVDNHGCHLVNRIDGNPVLIDGNYFANPEEHLFDERYFLSRSGVFVVTGFIQNGEVKEPIINGFGCLYRKEIETFLPMLKNNIKTWLAHYDGETKQKEQRLRKDVEHYIYDKLRRRPKVLANVLEV